MFNMRSIYVLIAKKVSVFEVILVHISQNLSVFSSNAGKYGPEWLRIQRLFMQYYGRAWFWDREDYAFFLNKSDTRL